MDIFNPSYPTLFGMEIAPTTTQQITLNAATTYAAGMVKPTVSKNVTSLQFLNWGHGGSFVAMTVELRTDNGGKPSATVLQTGTVTPAANFTWNSATITSQAVVAGTAYWIVIYGASISGTNTLEIREFNDPSSLISGVTHNFSAATSTDSGANWTNAGTTWAGCVGLGYSDATYEGCGYGDFDSSNVGTTATGGGADEWGEKFVPTTTIKVNTIGFNIQKSDAGTPTDVLNYYIYNVTGSASIETGQFMLAATPTTAYAWYTANLASIRTLTAGNTYSVGLSTNVVANTRYQINSPKTVNNGNSNAMTFGGTTWCRLNGPNNIGPDASRDIAFRLGITNPIFTGSYSKSGSLKSIRNLQNVLNL
jgi:hypothetical protein